MYRISLGYNQRIEQLDEHMFNFPVNVKLFSKVFLLIYILMYEFHLYHIFVDTWNC